MVESDHQDVKPNNSSNSNKKSPNTLVNDVLSVINRMGPSSPYLPFQGMENESPTPNKPNPASVRVESLKFDDFSESTMRSIDTTVFDTDNYSHVAEKDSANSTEKSQIGLNEQFDRGDFPRFMPHRCHCTEMVGYMNRRMVNPNTKLIKKKSTVTNMLKTFFGKNRPDPCDYYRITTSLDEMPPKRLIFDLVNVPIKQCKSQQIPENYTVNNKSIQTSRECKNCNNEKVYCFPETNLKQLESITISNRSAKFDCCGNIRENAEILDDEPKTRVDVYYFDHGNSTYLRTTDKPPIGKTEILAEKTETYTTRFWAETFGSFQIGISFCTGFILQLFRFIISSIIRPLTIGIVQLASDYFFKPCLTTVFNALIQPPLIFLYNVATSLRDLCDPVAEGIGYFLRELAFLVSSCRLFDYNNKQDRKYVKKVDKNVETV